MASCQRKQRAALARNARAREQTRENAEGLASVLDLVDQTRRRRLGSFAGNIKPNLGKIGFCRGASGAQSGHRQGIGLCRRPPRQRLRHGSDHRPREEAVSRPLTHRLTDTIASMTASSRLAHCSTTLAEAAPKSSRKRARSSVGLISVPLPKTARRLCVSCTAHATCRQLNRHPNEFRPLPWRRAPAGCELDQVGLTADNRRRPADSCLAIYLPGPKAKSLLTAQVASD
jgi:hypothetical protein